MDSLHLLIKKMTKQEKRYFKTFFGKNKVENYLELFNILNSLEEYDEASVLKKLSNQIFAKNLSSGKNYLYQQILKSLRLYYSGSKNKSAHFQMCEYLQEIYILREKGLKEEVKRMIKKAKKFANQYALDNDLLKLSEIERELVCRFEKKKIEYTLNKVRNESNQLLEKINQKHYFLTSYEDLFILTRKKINLAQKEFNLSDSNLMVNPTTFSWASYYFHFGASLHYMTTGQNTKANFHLKRLLGYFEEDLKMNQEYLDLYLNILNNYYTNSIELNEMQSIRRLSNRLSELSPKNHRDKVKIIQHKHYYKMLYHLILQDYQEVIKMESELEEFLDMNGNQLTINRRLTFLYNLALAYFMQGVDTNQKYEKEQNKERALDWLLKIESEPKFETRVDIKKAAKFLIILIHYDLGNESLVENKILMFKYYQKKNNLPNTEETYVLNYLVKVINAIDVVEKKKYFGEMFKKLQTGNRGIVDRINHWLSQHFVPPI